MKLSGRTPRPWVKLWKEERGSFAQLPFLTRAVASELLKFLDDDGRIFVGAKHPADALAFVAGATRGDRRVMRPAVDDLVAHGYLRVIDGWAEAAGYSLWQYGEAATTAHEPTTAEQRTDHDGATTEERPRNEEEPKCAESLSSPKQEGEERRGEEEGEERDTEDPVLTVFDRWLAVTNRTGRTKLDAKRRRCITWALKAYGLAEAMQALEGLARSDFHMGRDPKSKGERYDDLTLVFRNAEKLERFRDMGAPSAVRNAWRPPVTAEAYAASATTPDDDEAALAAMTADDLVRLEKWGVARG